ncbi:MAG: VCBS repeat-containing protein [Dokdonella sp.]
MGLLAVIGCMQPGMRSKPAAILSTASTSRVEAVAKREGDFRMLGNGRVRIMSRGEFVLDHEDSDHLYIIVYPTPAVVPSFRAAEPTAVSETPVPDKRGALKLVDIGHGLPHTGQWRDNFAVGDLLGDGSTQLVFAPPRKSGDTPLIFREQPDGWHRISLQVPVATYDYGGAAVADIDGDGRNDLVLAMHLTGFSALRAEANGTFSAFAPNLSKRRDAQMSGSGVAVLALPATPRTAATVMLLREPVGASGSADQMPGLATYRYSAERFINIPLAGKKLAGDRLEFAPSTVRCAAKLAVRSTYSGPPPLFETRDETTWNARAIESFPDPAATRVSAVSLGDADGYGCSDIAVAYSRRIGDAWHSVVDVYLDRGTNWQRINLADDTRGARVTAMTFAASAPRSGAQVLFALDDDGKLRAYGIRANSGELLLDSPAPDWRHGCAGTDIHALPPDSSGELRVAASFAGEPIMGAFDRCRDGGGLEAWRVEDVRA